MAFFKYLQANLSGIIREKLTYCTLKITNLKITNLKILVFIVNLINGHICTLKIKSLHRFINFLRLHYPALPIYQSLLLKTSPIGSNSWLSGMWDAN